MYTPTSVFKNKPKAAAGPPAASNLIDDVGVDAVIAVGLRKLRAGYTGDCIKVRRASDSATQDIGFVGEDVDTSAIATFCAGTNGYVHTWYDQSGNGFDLIQATAGNLIYDVTAGVVTDSQGNTASKTTELSDTSGVGDYFQQGPAYTGKSNKTPTLCMVMEYYYGGSAITIAENGNGYAMGTYGANNNKFKTIKSNGLAIAQLGTISQGDTFAVMNFMNDDAGTNLSFMNGSSNVGLGNGGTEALNKEIYTAEGFNAPTYDQTQFFYCCAASLAQNMFFHEFVFWDITATETTLTAIEQTAYFTNVNTYYSLIF